MRLNTHHRLKSVTLVSACTRSCLLEGRYELELQTELNARFATSNHTYATLIDALSAMLAPR